MKITFKSFLNESEMKSTGIISTKAFLEGVKEKCQPFLADMGKRMVEDDIFIFRGFANQASGMRLHGTVRSDRNPKDTDIALHELFNNWTKEKFGIYTRSECLFAIGDESEAVEFGSVYAIIPVGNYEVIYSPLLKDPYDQLFSNPSKLIMNFHEVNKDNFIEVLEKYELITDEDKHWEDDDSNRMEFQTFRTAFDSVRFGFQSRAPKKDMENLKAFMVNEIFERAGYVKDSSCKRAASAGTEIMIHCKEYFAIGSDIIGDHREMIDIIKRAMK